MIRKPTSSFCAYFRIARSLVAIAAGTGVLSGGAVAQSTFAGNAQHTANYSTKAQYLNALHWTTSIDLNNTGGYAHYGAPVMTAANTVFVPVKTGATDGFQINAFSGTAGGALYSLSTDYLLPPHNWIPTYQPVLAPNPAGTRLYYPGAGGSVYYINNVDSVNHGAPVQQVFYTTLANYQANSAGFNSTVFINTPITADSSGNIFFGFRVSGNAPAPLSTSQSGFVRIDANGNATYVLAGTAAGDNNIGFDSHNSAPALSNDQSTLYVSVKAQNNEGYAYLLGLNSTTLATQYKVFLRDPRSNGANSAVVLDDSTASPMVGPDDDVYMGVYGNPSNASRGFLLHFSADLTVTKPAGGFGWDYTPGVVPVSMVPSYTGAATYLLFCKYNNYANAGGDSGDGANRIALLDPTSTQVDAHASSNGLAIMREVLTVIGPTPDVENTGPALPYAVREWCINSPAVSPANNSIYMPSEDGRLYRWNLLTNSLDQFVQLNVGIGEPYVPTIIAPDGQVYTLNGGTLSAAGSPGGVGAALTSSSPDVRNTVVGQSVTFSVAVTNTGNSGLTPTGVVNITDTTYHVINGSLSTTTTPLATNLALDATGHAILTTSKLTADKHFINVTYAGDANFPAAGAALVQFVHAAASKVTLTSSANPAVFGQQVTLKASIAGIMAGASTPSGQVTFRIGSAVIAQVPVNGSGVASFSTSSLALGASTISATYASDTVFAASASSLVQLVTSDATVSTVASNQNPSVVGQAVTFTATVTAKSPGSGVVAGTVTFRAGTVQLDTLPLNSVGQAAFTTSALPLGASSITVTYNGRSNFGSSTSLHLVQLVTKASTSTSLNSSSVPSVYGQPVVFNVTVTANSPGGGTPNGTVTFKNGTTSLNTVTLTTTGHAAYTTSSLPVGSLSITAVYNGSAAYTGSTSLPVSKIVNSAATTSTVASLANPAVFGQSVTFTASVKANAPGSGVPSGTVTFLNGTTILGVVTLNTAANATFTTPTLALPVGIANITVVYSGSANFTASTSAVLNQTVRKDATLTTVASSLNPSVLGQAVTFTTTVKAQAPGSGVPTGTVIFKDGGAVLMTVTLSGGTASYMTSSLTHGTHEITVTYTGDTNYLPSTETALIQKVN